MSLYKITKISSLSDVAFPWYFPTTWKIEKCLTSCQQYALNIEEDLKIQVIRTLDIFFFSFPTRHKGKEKDLGLGLNEPYRTITCSLCDVALSALSRPTFRALQNPMGRSKTFKHGVQRESKTKWKKRSGVTWLRVEDLNKGSKSYGTQGPRKDSTKEVLQGPSETSGRHKSPRVESKTPRTTKDTKCRSTSERKKIKGPKGHVHTEYAPLQQMRVFPSWIDVWNRGRVLRTF